MKKAFMYVMVLCVGMFVFGCGDSTTKKSSTTKSSTTTTTDTKTTDKDTKKP
jgi:PBP1b-binding outer membrane lipoprotein LpoB